MRVSLARAYAMGGMAQMARFRQPGAAAMAFMNVTPRRCARPDEPDAAGVNRVRERAVLLHVSKG